jgi:hypothetical protein
MKPTIPALEAPLAAITAALVIHMGHMTNSSSLDVETSTKRFPIISRGMVPAAGEIE